MRLPRNALLAAAALALVSFVGLAEAQTPDYGNADLTLGMDASPPDYFMLCPNNGTLSVDYTVTLDHVNDEVRFVSTDDITLILDRTIFAISNSSDGDISHYNGSDTAFQPWPIVFVGRDDPIPGMLVEMDFEAVTDWTDASVAAELVFEGATVTPHLLERGQTEASSRNVYYDDAATGTPHYYYNDDNEYRGQTVERQIPNAAAAVTFEQIGSTDIYVPQAAAGGQAYMPAGTEEVVCEYGTGSTWTVPDGVQGVDVDPIVIKAGRTGTFTFLDLNDHAYSFQHELSFITPTIIYGISPSVDDGVITSNHDTADRAFHGLDDIGDYTIEATARELDGGPLTSANSYNFTVAYSVVPGPMIPADDTEITGDEDAFDLSSINRTSAADYFTLNGNDPTYVVGQPVTSEHDIPVSVVLETDDTITVKRLENAHTFDGTAILYIRATNDTATVTHEIVFDIEPVDDPPVQRDSALTVDEGEAFELAITSGSSDPSVIALLEPDTVDADADGVPEPYVYQAHSIERDAATTLRPENDCDDTAFSTLSANTAGTVLTLERPEDCETDVELRITVEPAGSADTTERRTFTFDLDVTPVPDHPKYAFSEIEATAGSPVYVELDPYDPDEEDQGKAIMCTAADPPVAALPDVMFTGDDRCTLYGNLGPDVDGAHTLSVRAATEGGNSPAGTPDTEFDITVGAIGDTEVRLNAGQSHSFDLREYIRVLVDGININEVDIEGNGWNIDGATETDYEVEATWGSTGEPVEMRLRIIDNVFHFALPDPGDIVFPDGFDPGTDRIIVKVTEVGSEFGGTDIAFDRQFYFSVDPAILLVEDPAGIVPGELEARESQAAGTRKEITHADSAVTHVAVEIPGGADPAFTVAVYDNATDLAYDAHSDKSSAGVLEDISTWEGTPIIFLPGAVDIGASSPDCPCHVVLSYTYGALYDLGVGNVSEAVLKKLEIFHFEDDGWVPLPTHGNSTVQFEARPHDRAGLAEIVGVTDTFSPFAIGLLNPHPVAQGGDSSEWKRKPTFGASWETGAQLVRDGFAFNGRTLDVTDNWHTEFELTSAVIGEDNTVTAKVYAQDGIDMFSLALGVPRIGMQQEAEAEILVDLERDHESGAGFAVTSVVHNQDEPLLDEGGTGVVVSSAPCGEPGRELCTVIDIGFRIMAPLKHEVLAISAIDERNRITTTYINDGVVFDGASLLPPATASYFAKKTSQDAGGTILLVQPDRRYNSWADQDGYLWEKNAHGTWMRVTHPPVPERSDAPVHVMTRYHSEFAGVVGEEAGRAMSSWDAGSVAGTLGPAFAYDLPIQHVPRLERLAPSLEAEHERATMALERPGEDAPRITYDAGILTASGAVEPGTGGLVLHVFEGLSLSTVDVPVDSDGSFEASLQVGGGFTYAYLESGGAVLARH